MNKNNDDLYSQGYSEDQEQETELTREEQLEKAKKFNEEMQNRGIVYMSRIPPGMTVHKLRSLLEKFLPERIFLQPESRYNSHKGETRRKSRLSTGGNGQRRYVEGWIEFKDKNLAKLVAMSLNGQKIGQKKGDAHFDDTWNFLYLSKFKWSDLVESGVAAKEERKKKLNRKIELAKREHDEYLGRADRAANLKGALERKAKKILIEEGEDPNDEKEIKKVIATRIIKKVKQNSN